MPTEDTTTSPSGLDVTKLFSELEVPFPPEQVRWRVTNTTNDKKRGQVVPYADCRAYTDRLNALFTPQGWTREYKVQTMTNITRVKKGGSILSGRGPYADRNSARRTMRTAELFRSSDVAHDAQRNPGTRSKNPAIVAPFK